MQSNLDLYIDGQADTSEAEKMKLHLASCTDCEALRLDRISLRVRLRSVAKDVAVPPDLDERIRRSIFKEQSWGSRNFQPLAAIAAAALIAVGGFYYVRQGSHSKSPLFSAHVAPLMQVGLSQHVHCGVLREYPAVAPTLLELAHAGGASAGLINAVESHAPEQCHVVMAHRCTYNNRIYTHVIARGDGHLMSLLITRRNPGEAFEKEMKAVARELDSSIFASSAQGYSVDAFETSGYLVYLVSNLEPSENLRRLQFMTAEVQAALL